MHTLHELCLTCLSKSTETHSLNDIVLENLKILEILEKLLPSLMDNKQLPLPNCICNECVDKLINSYVFHKQCLDSIQNLYKLWQEKENESKPNMIKKEMENKNLDFDGIEQIEEDESAIKMFLKTIDDEKNPLECISMDFLDENKRVLELSSEENAIEAPDESDKKGEKLHHANETKIDNKNDVKIILKQEDKIRNKQHELSNDDINETESHQCKLCLKTFKHSHGLNMHITKKHLKKYLYNCDKCNKGFMQEELYVKHQNRHLGIKTHKCQQCGKAFESNSTLNQHLKSHSNETPYLCTLCGKSFNRSGTLSQHMLRHGDATPFECTVCGKKFKCLSDHIAHMLTHTKGKFYECEICGKRLANSTSMLYHKLVHSGEKPFKCDLCDKSFSSSSNMKSHRRIHTGEKPYNCPYCSKEFRQTNDRKKHVTRVHLKQKSSTVKKIK